MESVKSGYIHEVFLPTVGDYIWEWNFIQEPATYRRQVQRIYGTLELGAGIVVKKSFVLDCRGGKDRKQVRVAMFLLLF